MAYDNGCDFDVIRDGKITVGVLFFLEQLMTVGNITEHIWTDFHDIFKIVCI